MINASVHHPVMLAREVVSLDHLSGGRLELGLGAGHTPSEFAACGVPMLAAAARKTRLAEFVEIVRALVDGETVDHHTQYFDLQQARNVAPAYQQRLPILVGGSGSTLLAHAGEHADIVGLTGLGRTLADGHHHDVRFAPEVVDAEVATVTAAAAVRRDGIDPELNVLVQVVDITSDREASAQKLADEIPSLTVDDALSTPFVALGTHDEIAQHIRAMRRRWGLSYFVVRDAEAFAPVIARLR